MKRSSLLTHEDVPPALKRYVPPGAWLKYPPQGMTSEVALVDGDIQCVLKRCRDPVYLEWLSREHRVLRALRDSHLPIPRVLDYAELNAEDRHEAWLVMSRLEGRSLWSDMLQAAPKQRASLLRRLGESLQRLHATPVPAALRSESPWVDRKLAAARENLAWCDGTPELLADLHRRRLPPVSEVLVHGDLALDNVLIAPDGAMSFIDWSDGDQGDPRYDIALALQTAPEIQLTEMEEAAFFEGYGTAPIDRLTRKWFEDLYEFF